MHIIDFHTHTFPDNLAARALESLRADAPEMVNRTDGTRRGLLDSMKSNDIDASVVLPVSTRPEQVRPINRNAVTLNSPELIAFGTVFPGAPEITAEIDFLRQSGIKGVKLHPEYQEFHVDDRAHYPMYDALRDAGLIVVFHAGWDPGPFTCERALPHALRRVVDDFPGLRIVAAHMGGMKVWNDVQEHLTGADLFFDTSAVMDGMTREQFVRIVRAHGAERILFATDSPWFDQGEYVHWVDGMALSDREKEAIFGGNARRLLGSRSPFDLSSMQR